MSREMSTETSPLKVVMVPWLGYGHISPFLELAKKLSQRNFHIYICSTPINLFSIKSKIPESYSASIELVEIHIASTPDLPPHYHTTNGIPPHLMSALRAAFRATKTDFSRILEALHPQLLIHDILLHWPAKVAHLHNVPSATFSIFGAITWSYGAHVMMNPEGTEYPVSNFRFSKFEKGMISELAESYKRDSQDEEGHWEGASQIALIRTSRELEGPYIDHISQVMGVKPLPVGPLLLTDFPPLFSGESDLLEWLGNKEKLSTVFLSFGSEYYLKTEEIEEIAYGLELSRVNFIWALRFPVGQEVHVEEILPRGFLDRIGDRGRIETAFVPQIEILRHSSVGGFVSHCGLSSMLESILFGVPMIGMPVQYDQPLNGKLLVELGLGVEVVRDDEQGRWNRENIAKAIKDVVIGETRETLRKTVWEMRNRLLTKGEQEIDEVAKELTQICGTARSISRSPDPDFE